MRSSHPIVRYRRSAHSRRVAMALFGATLLVGGGLAAMWPRASGCIELGSACDCPARPTTEASSSPALRLEPIVRPGLNFVAGRSRSGFELFTHVWQSTAPGPGQGDGLGPYFNERSCVACHKLGGIGGAGPNEHNVQVINTRLVRFDGVEPPPGDPEALRKEWFPQAVDGIQVLHRQATVPGYKELRRKRLKLAMPHHPEVADLPWPLIDTIVAPTAPPLSATSRLKTRGASSGRVIVCGCRGPIVREALEERNTPALFGTGLIDRVSLAELEQLAAAQPLEVRGRPALLPDGEVGRFGWKGQNASLLDFCETACAVELGLETPRKKQTPRPFKRRTWDEPKTEYAEPVVPDVTAEDVWQLTAFTASLPAPRRSTPPHATVADVVAGEALFTSIGCAVCHAPNVGSVRGLYSDLLLHRIGTSGSGFYGAPAQPVDVAGKPKIVPPAADEFRTPPLWGVADSSPYLHDGSAPTLEAATRRHSVQARASVLNFTRLPADDRRRLLAFLESLRAPTIDP